MQAKRLLKLADFIEFKVPRSGFNLGVWKCKTTACAVGWAPVCFPRSKFEIQGNVMPYYKGSYGFFAVEEFFGLSGGQALFLFSPNWYPKSHRSKRYVANRIRAFVKTNGKTAKRI